MLILWVFKMKNVLILLGNEELFMLSTKEKKFIICFVIYVALFIASAFYPDGVSLYFGLGSIHIVISSLPTIFCSNLVLPFIGNTLLLIYFFKDEIKTSSRYNKKAVHHSLILIVCAFHPMLF